MTVLHRQYCVTLRLGPLKASVILEVLSMSIQVASAQFEFNFERVFACGVQAFVPCWLVGLERHTSSLVVGDTEQAKRIWPALCTATCPRFVCCSVEGFKDGSPKKAQWPTGRRLPQECLLVVEAGLDVKTCVCLRGSRILRNCIFVAITTASSSLRI